jgi:two-component system phosphate regulon response regulator PhoB
MKIMAIDDDPFILDVIHLMLRDEHEMITAVGAEDGLKIARSTHIDLILLDWMMPGMDGLSFLNALKADEALRNIPVIFVSGKIDTDDIQQAMNAGAADYVRKPFSKADLLQCVRVIQQPT